MYDKFNETMNLPGRFEVLIITLSDRALKGEYQDLSGPRIQEKLRIFQVPKMGFEIRIILYSGRY